MGTSLHLGPPSQAVKILPLALVAASCMCVASCSCQREPSEKGPADQPSAESQAGVTAEKGKPREPVPEVDAKLVDAAVGRIQQVFEQNDVAAATALTHPAIQARYQRIFGKHSGELRRVAVLLSTRKLVAITPEMTEYEVTENGESFSVIFEKVGTQWLLSGL